MDLSVIIATHNPDRARLRRTLAGLWAQTLPADAWEVILIDNASAPALEGADWDPGPPARFRLVRAERLGLTPARLRGFAEARGDLLVLVDDDNVLGPSYLAAAAARFAADPTLMAAGGRSLPEFAAPPPIWTREFDSLLALRDLGPAPQWAAWDAGTARAYPPCAPIGAGMVLRRSAAETYARALAREPARQGLDRAGAALRSGGDNDLVLTILAAGGKVAYFPELVLTHLIPAARSGRSYLGALNRAIARSWVAVLALHGIVLWPAIGRASVPLRQARAWLRTRAWSNAAAWVRWQGLCGIFEGRADLGRGAGVPPP